MTTTVDSDVFVDANILVYASFDHVEWHSAAQARLSQLGQARLPFWTSRQVLREFLAATSRPGFLAPLPPAPFLARLVEDLETRFRIAEDDRGVTSLLLELIDKPGARGRQVHDANIVATMRHYGIPNLLTHNTSDFARYQPWITVLPLIP
jgi:predicted nucleic acid-binding protein